MNVVEKIQENLNKGQVSEYSNIQAELGRLHEIYGSVVPDCTNKDGYEFSKEAAKVCRDARLSLESIRKEKKKPFLDYGRLIDSQAKEITSALTAIELPHAEAYKAEDAKKKAILEAKKQKIAQLNNSMIDYQDKSEDEILARIEEVQDMEVSKEEFGRLVDDAAQAQVAAVDALHRCHAAAIDRRIAEEKAEAERLELEALRLEKQKRDQEEQERLEKERKAMEIELQKERERQAAEQARIDAENKAKLEAEQLERQKAEAEQRAIEAEQREKEAAIRAERQAKEAAERAAAAERQAIAEQKAKAKAETEAREADRKHRAAINNAVMGALIAGGVDEAQAKLATKLIAGKKVPHTAIRY